MANIYNDSSEFIREASGNTNQNANFNQVITKYLVAENAAIDNLNVDQSAVFTGGIETNALKIDGLNNGDILINTSGEVNGLNIGPNKNVLTSNGTIPAWTNALDINSLTTNSVKINGTQNGDLLIMNSSGTAQRLAVGASGTFLISDGTNPQWEPIPNPFIVGAIQINNGAQFVAFPNSTLFTDSNGNLIFEKAQYTAIGNQSFNNTPTQLYGNAVWNVIQNGWYKLKINLFTSNTTPFHGIVQLVGQSSTIQIAAFNYNGFNLDTVQVDLTLKNTFASGLIGIAITAQTTSGTATLSDGTIFFERIPTPIIY